MDVAVVGTEAWTDSWVQAAVAHAHCEVRAVWDPLRARAASLAQIFGAPAYEHGEDALLADERVGAIVLGPCARGRRLARECLTRGRHVWLAGPTDVRLEPLRSLIPLAAEEGVALGAGPQLRRSDLARRVREIVQTGHIGHPVLVDWEDLATTAPPSWALLAGLDLVTWLLGAPAATVCADARTAGGRDYARVQFRAEGGGIGVCAVSRGGPSTSTPWQVLTVIGGRGQLRFDTRLTGLVQIDAAGLHPLCDAVGNGHALDLAAWLSAVSAGRLPPAGACSPEALRLAAAVQRSLSEGDAVGVREVEPE